MEQKKPEQPVFKDLKRVMNLVARVDEGRELLRQSEKKDCIFRYDDTLPADVGGAQNLIFDAGKFKPRISINPLSRLERQVSTLPHELRHFWQDFRFKRLPSKLKYPVPLLKLAIVRVREGDAHVFQMHMAKQIGRVTRLDVSYLSGNRFEFMDAFKKDVEWEKLFENFQRSKYARYYDNNVIERCEEMAAGVAGNAARLSEIFNVSSAAVFGDLRNMTRKGINDDSPIYLPYKSSDELIESVLRHVDPAIIARAKAITP